MNTWRKSSYSGGQANCVEVGTAAPVIAVRDTKDREAGPVLRIDPADWARFTRGIKG